jgi:hypothetical protein
MRLIRFVKYTTFVGVLFSATATFFYFGQISGFKTNENIRNFKELTLIENRGQFAEVYSFLLPQLFRSIFLKGSFLANSLSHSHHN